MARVGLRAAAAVFAGVLAAAPAGAETYRRHFEHVLGTTLDIAVTADSEAVADAAETAIRAEIDRLNAVFNTYDETSEISRLNEVAEAAETAASPELIAVLSACEDWRARTDNAFSCRIGRLVEAWRDAEAADAPPERAAMRLFAGEIRRAEITIDADGGTVARDEPVAFDTNGIATGFIVDRALEAARVSAPEARGLLIDIGGDLRVWGEGEDGAPWRIGVAAPEHLEDNASTEILLHVSDRAVTTSGLGPRDRMIGGTAYSHILSPSSGWSVDYVTAATVVAPDAETADAVATALVVMPLSEGLTFAESLDGVEAMIVATDGRRHWTTGWPALTTAETTEVSGQAPVGSPSALPNGYTLTVDYEIPAIDAGDYEQPYVAVWIGDADRKLVRVLELLGEEARWIEENYVWHRRFGRYAGSLADAVARPTRPPGAYSLVWDGLRDDGSAAGPGSYVLHVEVAREHGGHQYESVDLVIGQAPFEATVAASEELGEIRVRYGAAP